MFRTSGLKLALGGTSVAALLAGGAAMAQTQTQAADGAAEELSVEEIVVTGSRIRRTGFQDIFQPAVVVNTDEIEKRGFENIADALNDLPFFQGSVTGTTLGSNQNVGQEFLNFFGLGTQRTLVTVNGRRFVPGNPLSGDPSGRLEGSQVDISNFTSALVERAEALSVGGAPLYGADAIAGTVNLVLKQDFEGIDIRFQFRDGFKVSRQDDYNVEAAFGANTADGRGNVAVGLQFEKQRGSVANDFPRLRERATTFGDGADKLIIDPREGRFNILEGPTGFLLAPTPGVPLPGLAGGLNVLKDANGNTLTFPGNPDGSLGFFDPGDQVGTSAIFFAGGNGFDLTDFQETIVPIERFVFQSIGHYDINDKVTVFLETNFLDSQATDLISQQSEAFNTAFLNTQGIGSFGISIDNPFISDADRTTLRGALDRLNRTDQDTLFLNGINLGLLPDAGANFVEQTTYRILGGVKGDFRLAERNFNWEVSMNFGRTRQTRGEPFTRGGAFFNAVDSVRLDEDLLGQLTSAENLQAIQESTNLSTINVIRNGQFTQVAPTDARVGDIVCHTIVNAPGSLDRDPDNPRGNVGITNPNNVPTPDPDVANCTPVNLFNGFGNPPEAIDFLTSFAVTRGKVQQADFQAFVTGDLFDLPAGTVQVNLGVERRRDFGSFRSDGVLADGLSRAVAVPSIPRQEIVSNEGFAEAVIPVFDAENNLGINDLLGIEFISRMEVNGAYRRVKSSNADSGVNIYSAGGTMQLFGGDLTVRGNWTRSVRQPSIVELFAPKALTFNQTGDPCDNRNINAARSTPRAENCLEAARQQGFTEAELIDVGGGNVALQLAPGDGPFQTPSVNAAISLVSSGNPDLNFEVGNAYTVGGIWTPHFIPGLTLGVDYIRILIKDVINEPAFAFFTRDCFDNSNFATGALRDTCSNFFRSGPADPVDNSVIGGFDIVTGTTQFLNQDIILLHALQGNLNYTFDVADASRFLGFGPGTKDLGTFRINGRFWAPRTFRDSATGLPLDEKGLPPNQVGSTGRPELTFTIDIDYSFRDFNFFWRATYTDNADPCFKRVEGDCDDIPDIARPIKRSSQHDASIGYQVTDNVSFRGGVNNVLGNRPNLVQDAFRFGGNTLGRTYFLSVGFRM